VSTLLDSAGPASVAVVEGCHAARSACRPKMDVLRAAPVATPPRAVRGAAVPLKGCMQLAWEEDGEAAQMHMRMPCERLR
jgi:hypothetical protein